MIIEPPASGNGRSPWHRMQAIAVSWSPCPRRSKYRTRGFARVLRRVFFEKVSCALQKDGENVIICWPKEPPGVVPDPRLSEGWPVTKIRKAYERLGEEHPRVVRYVDKLEDGSLVIERLWPGPLHADNDCTSDVTGDKTNYGEEGGCMSHEWVPYDDTAIHGSVKEDLFYWATFIWRLVTNDFTDQSHSDGTQYWEPVVPVEVGIPFGNPDAIDILSDRLDQSLFQKLEEARLGSVLLKVCHGKYVSADEVAEEVRSIASIMDITVIGDEVELEETREDIFEVVQIGRLPRNRRMRFKTE